MLLGLECLFFITINIYTNGSRKRKYEECNHEGHIKININLIFICFYFSDKTLTILVFSAKHME